MALKPDDHGRKDCLPNFVLLHTHTDTSNTHSNENKLNDSYQNPHRSCCTDGDLEHSIVDGNM